MSTAAPIVTAPRSRIRARGRSAPPPRAWRAHARQPVLEADHARRGTRLSGLPLRRQGPAGYNVGVWGGGWAAGARSGRVGDDVDFDDFSFVGLTPPARVTRTAGPLRMRRVSLDFDFTRSTTHSATGQPGRPAGVVRTTGSSRPAGSEGPRGRRPADRVDRVGHRDHSWGHRDWGAPQHWKWFVAYTPTAAHSTAGSGSPRASGGSAATSSATAYRARVPPSSSTPTTTTT